MGVGIGSFLDREKAKFTITAGCISSSWWNWRMLFRGGMRISPICMWALQMPRWKDWMMSYLMPRNGRGDMK